MKIEDNVIQEIFDQLIKSSNYRSRQLNIKKFNKENKYIKKGIAITPEKFGISDFKLVKLLEEKLTPTPLSIFQSKLNIKQFNNVRSDKVDYSILDTKIDVEDNIQTDFFLSSKKSGAIGSNNSTVK